MWRCVYVHRGKYTENLALIRQTWTNEGRVVILQGRQLQTTSEARYVSLTKSVSMYVCVSLQDLSLFFITVNNQGQVKSSQLGW